MFRSCHDNSDMNETFKPSDIANILDNGGIPEGATGIETIENFWVDCIGCLTFPLNRRDFTSGDETYRWRFDGHVDCEHDDI